jgi:eukaryotic translation initiation factor 2C
VTIVICGKRHRTRFYPTEASAADRDGNPRPGTVVDGGVTAVYEYDFFLQGQLSGNQAPISNFVIFFNLAHGGLQGTARPIHYSVICDEIGFKADLLQQVTNVISYTFARATNAVSLVSPAYYADLACKRGRCYLHKLLQGVGDEDMELDAGAVWKEAERLWHNGVSGSLNETMFYL